MHYRNHIFSKETPPFNMEFDNKGIKTVHISEYPVIVVYIIFV